jgi:hypothetical protein
MLFIVMIVLSQLTTFIAVFLPVHMDLNQRQISNILKATA